MTALTRAFLVSSLILTPVRAEPPAGPQASKVKEGAPARDDREKPFAKDAQVFKNVYSRPNDDTFQNATGNAGEPYEVARIQCALVVEKTADGFKVAFDWNAEMTTGRHVEAGNYFFLTDTQSNLASRPKDLDKKLGIRYPKGAGPESLPAVKVGSLLYSRLDLGKIDKDGVYEGKLVVRRGEKLGEGVSHFNEAGPKTGVFQLIGWKVELRDGKIVAPAVECKRGKEPQLKKLSSTYEKIDRSKKEHQPYPPQPKGAACKQEKVGDGESSTELHVHSVKLAQDVGKAIKLSGCLDCHGEGNGDNQLFCDDGTAINPTTTYRSLNDFIDPKFDWSVKNPDGKLRYPKGMNHCCSELRRNLKEADAFKKLKELIEKSR